MGRCAGVLMCDRVDTAGAAESERCTVEIGSAGAGSPSIGAGCLRQVCPDGRPVEGSSEGRKLAVFTNGVGDGGRVSRIRPGLAGRVKRRPAPGGGGGARVSHECVLELDGELAQCAKGAAALRMELGEAFDVLCRRGWQSELGYSDPAELDDHDPICTLSLTVEPHN